MKIFIPLNFVLLHFLLTASAVACPVGVYDVLGWSPGVSQTDQANYRGVATVQTVGQTCDVVWQIGNERYVGVAVASSSPIFEVAYAQSSRRWFGIARYEVVPGGLSGDWAIHGDGKGLLGKEKWIKR